MFLVFFIQFAYGQAPKIMGSDETFWQAAYLDRLIGATKVNAYRPRGLPRAVIAGDFFEFGDKIRTPKDVFMQVIFDKNCWAILQGGHEVTIDQATWANTDHPRAIEMKSGWSRLWCKFPMHAISPTTNIEFSNANAWIFVRNSMMDVYPVEGNGEIKLMKGKAPEITTNYDALALRNKIEPMTGPFVKAVLAAEEAMKDIKDIHFYERFDLAIKNRWLKKPKSD